MIRQWLWNKAHFSPWCLSILRWATRGRPWRLIVWVILEWGWKLPLLSLWLVAYISYDIWYLLKESTYGVFRTWRIRR